MTDRSVFVIDLRSENRLSSDPVDAFRFPLAKAGITTPRQSLVTLRCTGGRVPLESANPASFDKRFRLYVENLPVRRDLNVTSASDDQRMVIAYGDYRKADSVYAKLSRADQPTIQLISGVSLPDVDVYLLDGDGNPFAPGGDWNIQLQLEADESLYVPF